MAFYQDDIVEQIKQTLDIRQVIESYIPLKQRGRNYVGRCPFHTEKTPSFTVSPDKQFYHCFGCGEGGDIITFVMKMENLNFAEALEMLADRAGITIEKSEQKEEIRKRKAFGVAVNRDAARFFYQAAMESPIAQHYFEDRGLKTGAIRRYGLGYADEKWDSLYNYLIKRGYEAEDLLQLDLISKRKDGRGYYDRFRQRIMFPIINYRGEVIGFGGRVLGDGEPKYLNTSDTDIFHKGKELYGLNVVSKSSNRRAIIMVEGYMDVISLYQCGYQNVSASLGTAFTKEQARLAHRYGQTIYLCYDSDRAGINATTKAIETCKEAEIPVKIIRLKAGMDPDDYVRKFGRVSFEERIKESLTPEEFFIELEISAYQTETDADLSRLLQRIAKIIGNIQSPVRRELFIKRYAEQLNFSSEALKAEAELYLDKKPIAKFSTDKFTVVAKTKNKGHILRQWLLLKQLVSEPNLAKDFISIIDANVFTEEQLALLYQEYIFSLSGGSTNQERYNRRLEDYLIEQDMPAYHPEDGLQGPQGFSETKAWVERLEFERLRYKREQLLEMVQSYDRNQENNVPIEDLLEEIAQINRQLSQRESDGNE